ncbi:MAG TPA: hypothetical protein VLV78_02315 [Thermoanaerobaculia bacterium]|nr:hypothetical protein [Thermoanaerobaculia bacterium]
MRFLRAAGVVLIVLCGLGFLTVADDLRHKGELAGVAAVGVAGIAAVAFSEVRLRRRR